MASSNRSGMVLAAVMAAAAVGIVVIFRNTRKVGSSKEKHDKRTIKPRISSFNQKRTPEVEIPPHIRREIHKERRRKRSIRFLAMKSPMYDNIEMFGPDDTLLCTIALKKANWYIGKGLAKWMEEGSKLKLLFEPKNGEMVTNTSYTLSHKSNHCVSCGDDENYMRHYIVPYCYRAKLPEKYKSHMPHDIVLLCPDCQLTSEQVTQRRQKKMENALRKDPSTALAVIPDRDLYRVKSGALALLQHGDKIPEERKRHLEGLVLKHIKKANVDKENQKQDENQDENQDIVLTEDILRACTEMDTHFPNPSYVSGADLVAEKLDGDDEAIEDFIRGWRRHFLQTMSPRFLPQGWGVDHPVHSDDR